MIILAALILGIALGLFHARKRGGNRLDMAQYAAIYAIIFVILGMFLTLIIHRASL